MPKFCIQNPLQGIGKKDVFSVGRKPDPWRSHWNIQHCRTLQNLLVQLWLDPTTFYCPRFLLFLCINFVPIAITNPAPLILYPFSLFIINP